jgi:hypothetical protein
VDRSVDSCSNSFFNSLDGTALAIFPRLLAYIWRDRKLVMFYMISLSLLTLFLAI